MNDNFNLKVVHLTSAHPRSDVRVYNKMCKSLSRNGYQVSLVVADGKSDETIDGVRIYDVGLPVGRFDRIINAVKRIYVVALALDADLYHFHDPELIMVGLKLKKLGKKVLFDSHEDVSKQILSKHYLISPLRYILSKFYDSIERRYCGDFDLVVAATPTICNKFLKMSIGSIDINNYPILGELDSKVTWSDKSEEICYIGSIAEIRGVLELIQALNQTHSGVRLNLCGSFSDSNFEGACKAALGWSLVNNLGQLDRMAVRRVLGRSVAGLVMFRPVPNHIDAQPNKMFEYMSAGIPVIASNFPLWREIVEGNKCGLCIDPMDPFAIANAIDYMVKHPEQARQMGENGRKAVLERYNWEQEESKLLKLYEEILKN